MMFRFLTVMFCGDFSLFLCYDSISIELTTLKHNFRFFFKTEKLENNKNIK